MSETKDEKAAEEYRQRVVDYDPDLPGAIVYGDDEAIIATFLAGIKHGRENPPWVSVEEGLPEEPGQYQVIRSIRNLKTLKTDVLDPGVVSVSEFTIDPYKHWKGFEWVITHWLPLPKGPKKEGE